MSLFRTVRQALCEWQRRVEWLIGPSQDDRQTAKIWTAMSESLVGRSCEIVARPFITALPHSRATRMVTGVQRGWRQLPAAGQLNVVGIAVVIAVTVHVMMSVAHGVAGWWWLLLPGMALAFGGGAIGVSIAARRNGSHS